MDNKHVRKLVMHVDDKHENKLVMHGMAVNRSAV